MIVEDARQTVASRSDEGGLGGRMLVDVVLGPEHPLQLTNRDR